MPIVDYVMWLGEIRLGTVMMIDVTGIWMFRSMMTGTPSVDNSKNNRHASAQNCARCVAHLVPEVCRKEIKVFRIEGGTRTDEYTLDDFLKGE